MKPFTFESKAVRTFLIALCLILSFIMFMQRRTKKYFKEAARLAFYNIQAEEVSDGTYRGKVYTSFMHVQLDVTVKDKKLSQITIIENEGIGGKKIQPLLDEMIAQNNTVVPAVKKEELASIVFIACADNALFTGLPEEKKAQLTQGSKE